MIDPSDVTHFDRSDEDLELFLLFCIVVAGKTAATQSRLLNDLLNNLVHVASETEKMYAAWLSIDGPIYRGNYTQDSPLNRIRFLIQHNILLDAIKVSKLGQYSKIERAFSQLAQSGIDLRSCTIQELEAIHGIGFKTSRFFLVHTRPDQPHAILDTHILKYMRDEMKLSDIPKSTPGSYKEYARLEKIFVDHCKELGRPVADLDLEIWTKYSRSTKQEMSNARG